MLREEEGLECAGGGVCVGVEDTVLECAGGGRRGDSL